jgi:phosphomannomutase
MDMYVDRLVQISTASLPHRLGRRQRRWRAVLERLVKSSRASITSSTRNRRQLPNHHPIPRRGEPSDLKALVAEKGCDFGIAFDGDADRIGAVDGEGRVIWGDQLLSILAEPVLRELPGSTIIADVKASQALYDRIAELGGKPLMWKTGHSLIKTKMKETGSPLAGEMSGHIFFKHQYYGFDDAIYSAIRLIRAVSQLGGSLTDLRSAMPQMINTPKCASRSTKPANSRSSRKCSTGWRRAAPMSTAPTARASTRPTAGGCCAPPTRRTCSSPAPKRRARKALSG